MIGITTSGDIKHTQDYLRKLLSASVDLHKYGKMGVEALSRATPVDTRLTANSWTYKIVKDRRGNGIQWYNTNVVNGIPVAILIQYGHATGTGGYVHGRDFINPAMRPVFDKIASNIWKR